MCILFIANKCHPDWPLVIAANRDEYFARPSSPMHFWEDHANILAGRDLEAGGTWLGVNRSGDFAAVTNYRLPGTRRADARSRGELVTRYLDGDFSQSGFVRFLESESNAYNAFNLVFGKPGELFAWDHERGRCRPLEAGFLSVSNGGLDQAWPKMARGVALLRDYIGQNEALDDERIFKIMQDRTRAPETELPETGIDPSLESALSSIFIEGETYGTRTTSVLRFNDRRLEIAEQNYLPGGESLTPRRYTIELTPAEQVHDNS